MSTIIYRKLVRDKIPEIIEKSGKAYCIDHLGEEAFINELYSKLDEEVEEFRQNRSVDELADILEVVFAISEARGVTPLELEQIKADKAEARGGFKKKLLLVSVEE